MDAIAIVDGSGRWWKSDYDSDMHNSFCCQMSRAFNGRADLMRGPSDEGYRFNDKASWAVKKLLEAKKAGAARLFLAGYSRGAAIVLKASGDLALLGIHIDGLFLFDPVERVPSRASVCSYEITDNVRFARVAQRDLKPALVKKYEGKLLQKPYNLLPLATKKESQVLSRLPYFDRVAWLGNPIRPEFGRFIVKASAKTNYKSSPFGASHGALGGVGWKDVEEDKTVQPAVAAWMNDAFKECALRVQIASSPPMLKFGIMI